MTHTEKKTSHFLKEFFSSIQKQKNTKTYKTWRTKYLKGSRDLNVTQREVSKKTQTQVTHREAMCVHNQHCMNRYLMDTPLPLFPNADKLDSVKAARHSCLFHSICINGVYSHQSGKQLMTSETKYSGVNIFY